MNAVMMARAGLPEDAGQKFLKIVETFLITLRFIDHAIRSSQVMD
jgi:hypothetical protein